MPTKKTTKTKKVSSKKTSSFDLQRILSGSDSYKSLIYGIVTVVVLFIVIALGIRTLQQNKAQIDLEAISTQNTDKNMTSKYVVTEGDTLWSIAEKEYNDGFKWNEIAKANNITNATSLEKGMQLTIPEIATTAQIAQNENSLPTVAQNAAASPMVTVRPTTTVSSAVTKAPEQKALNVPQGQKITGNSYKVVTGDTLWDISVKAYGNGYRWVDIAKSNNIVNPDLIYPGNEFKLPRP